MDIAATTATLPRFLPTSYSLAFLLCLVLSLHHISNAGADSVSSNSTIHLALHNSIEKFKPVGKGRELTSNNKDSVETSRASGTMYVDYAFVWSIASSGCTGWDPLLTFGCESGGTVSDIWDADVTIGDAIDCVANGSGGRCDFDNSPAIASNYGTFDITGTLTFRCTGTSSSQLRGYASTNSDRLSCQSFGTAGAAVALLAKCNENWVEDHLCTSWIYSTDLPPLCGDLDGCLSSSCSFTLSSRTARQDSTFSTCISTNSNPTTAAAISSSARRLLNMGTFAVSVAIWTFLFS